MWWRQHLAGRVHACVNLGVRVGQGIIPRGTAGARSSGAACGGREGRPCVHCSESERFSSDFRVFGVNKVSVGVNTCIA